MNRFMPFALTKNKKSTLISALIFLLCFAYLPGKINPLGSHVSARSIWDATLDVADARGLTNSTTSAAPQEGGAIAGTIRMFNGQIPDRGTIEIFLPQPDGTQNLVSEIRFDSLTEPDVVNPESGAYEIQDLAPGSYSVWVTANRYFEISH